MSKVSIIVAAYNIETYIDRCLDSLTNQTFDDLEIIVVNDGSTDNTLNKIMKKKSIDNRIKIIDKENQGLIEARKSGFSYATGEYILFIDGDDWLDNNTIKILYEKAISKNYDIVQYKYLEAYDSGKQKKDWDEITGDLNQEQLLSSYFLGNINHNIWSKFIKREFIINNQIDFPNKICYGEDLAFTFSLFINNPKMCIIDKYLYYYYQRDESLSNKISLKILEIKKATEFIKEQLLKYNMFEEYHEQFEYMAFRQNYYSKMEYIFKNNNELSNTLIKNWINLNIDISKNKYYRDFINSKSFKIKILTYILIKRYIYIARLYYKVTT